MYLFLLCTAIGGDSTSLAQFLALFVAFRREFTLVVLCLRFWEHCAHVIIHVYRIEWHFLASDTI